MGQELECRMRYRRRKLLGKAHLETDHLLFRGEERVKIVFKELTSVKASGGLLMLEYPDGPAAFELGAAAEKWARKILHPPSRADKLGLKPGMSIALEGKFEADFIKESGGATAGKGPRDLIFFAAERARDLDRIRKLAGGLKPNGALWIVYPKGVAVIREIEVLEAGRAAGLKDTKVASFSATHTALRFVIPLASR